MLNFFMILGWAREDEQEIMTLDEYVAHFNPAKISAKSVVFDLQKLAWINGQYIRNLKRSELEYRLKPFIPAEFPIQKLAAILELVFERLEKLADFEPLTEFFYKPIQVELALLLKRGTPELVKSQLEETANSMKQLDDWSSQNLETAIRTLQTENDWSKKQFFMMLRVAVTGRKATPPLFETIAVLGQNETLERLSQAVATLASQ
jgi:glutamyl-tRNA synthetase